MTVAYHQFESAPLIERLMREWRAAASEGDAAGAASALSGVPDPDGARPQTRGCTLFDLVVERFAESLTLSLRALISHRLSLDVVDVRAVATRAYLAQAPLPALLAPIAMGQCVQRGILLISAPLGCAMVDHLFGTSPRASDEAMFARAFNATEQALMARLAEAMLADLGTALAPVVAMPCRMETQQAEAAETAVQLRLAIEVNGAGGTVDLLLPFGALTAFPDMVALGANLGPTQSNISLSRPPKADAKAPEPIAAPTPAPAASSAPAPQATPAPWQAYLAARLRHVALRVDISLEGADVPLAHLVSVRVGDCLLLGDAHNLPLSLRIGGQNVVQAHLVQAAEGLALRPVMAALES